MHEVVMEEPTENDFSKKLQEVSVRKRCSWVNVNGETFQERQGQVLPSIDDILTGGKQLDLSVLKLRDPNKFVAGGLQENAKEWDTILEGHPITETIQSWLSDGVDVKSFTQPFKGKYQNKWYDSDFPPTEIFDNHASCSKFNDFISNEILKRVEMGAVRPLGRVEDHNTNPPYLVLPLTVEPSKPRLCIDARFLNLWMTKAPPCQLERLDVVPQYVYKDSYMTKCDDKSGYDHIKLRESSMGYFGFKWQGWYFVCCTLPFGWKVSQYVYQTVGLAASGYFRSKGIPCSLYVDDRLNGELITSSGPWSVPPNQRSDDMRKVAATAAIYIVLSTLSKLGYTIGINKSCFKPEQTLVYLGLTIDSRKKAFLLPTEKIKYFRKLLEDILSDKTVDMKTLKKLKGKCTYTYSLVVPAAKLFTREMSSAVRAAEGHRTKISPELRDEIEHWYSLESWAKDLTWRIEKSVTISMCKDKSGHTSCSVYSQKGHQQCFSVCLSKEEKSLPNATKELLALIKTLESVSDYICMRNCRVDIEVDSDVLTHIINGEDGGSSSQLTEYIQKLFSLLHQRNTELRLHNVMSPMHSRLSPSAWKIVQDRFGGKSRHTFDLMALDSNAALSDSGECLPHFTPVASPCSSGVDMFAQDLKHTEFPLTNPYIFPPFHLVYRVIHFLKSFGISFTIVVPEFSRQPLWWQELMTISSDRICLGQRGDLNVVEEPSGSGYNSIPCTVKLWAVRVKGSDT